MRPLNVSVYHAHGPNGRVSLLRRASYPESPFLISSSRSIHVLSRGRHKLVSRSGNQPKLGSPEPDLGVLHFGDKNGFMVIRVLNLQILFPNLREGSEIDFGSL